MSIVLVDSKPIFGGGQKMLRTMGAAVADQQPWLLRPSAAPESDTLHGLPVQRLNFPYYPENLRSPLVALGTLPAVMRTASIIRQRLLRTAATHVIANDVYSLIPLIPATYGLGIPLIAYLHSIDLPQQAHALLHRCTHIIACSVAAADAIPTERHRIHVIPNACHVDHRGVPWTDGPWVIGFSGRIDANKNLDGLLAGFALALPHLDRPGSPAHLVILGDGADDVVGPLRQRAQQADLAGRIHWHPWTSAPLPVMSRWHGLVLPSHREALPLCIIEAQLMRIPVIGTACGGIPELITDRVTGFLARSPAAPDLADALIRMRADPHLPLITQQALRQAEMRHHPRGYLHALRNVLELPGP